ncbi:MAG: hypothetical protein II135_04495 [Clostridia bacterium]|nr:hypothetical protein [Clostridia bacterium]
MAKFTADLRGDFDGTVKAIEAGVLSASTSATLEDGCDFTSGQTRCAVRVFERYSWFGGNRVSMNVTMFEGEDGVIRLCAITSGGSQAMFYKINTVGEEAFLDTIKNVVLQMR